MKAVNMVIGATHNHCSGALAIADRSTSSEETLVGSTYLIALMPTSERM